MFRILALGDSYTIGQGVIPSRTFPAQLAEALRSRNLNVAPPLIIARTGWTTGNLVSAISNASVKPPYDIVTLLIGVNNQFQDYDESSYSAGFPKLLATAIELAGGSAGRVIVISIPDYGVTPFGARFGMEEIGAAIDRFNAINRKVSEEKGARYVDITGISRKAESDASLLAPDALHPSAKMYGEWVNLIAPIAEDILKQ